MLILQKGQIAYGTASIGSGDAATAGLIIGMVESCYRKNLEDFSLSETCFVDSLGSATAFGTASCLSLLPSIVSEREIESLTSEIIIYDKLI